MLETETVECADKTVAIEMKSNSQGKFVKLTEVSKASVALLECTCVCL